MYANLDSFVKYYNYFEELHICNTKKILSIEIRTCVKYNRLQTMLLPLEQKE